MKNTSLEVYRASAGSGKTFTLAVKYITLLIENPEAYRHIVAVTFTNKATGEMKERILSQLYGIAYALPSSDDYMEKMQEAFPKLSKESICQKAKTALSLILHDYGHFRIQTIDSFFQSVLRSLARELELNGDVEFTLDGDEILDDAVDTFIRRLDEKSAEIKQVIEFIENNLENNRKWDVTYSIKNFAKNLLKEEYQERGKNLREEIDAEDGKTLKKFHVEVSAIKKNCEETILREFNDIGNRFFAIAGALSDNDFLGKSTGIWAFFNKLRNFTKVKAKDIPAIPKNAIKAIANNEIEKLAPKHPAICPDIAQLLDRVQALQQNEIYKLNSCDMSLEMYHQLGLLNAIAKTIKEENERENRFLLAETTYCLSEMILDNTTFIFEKIGTEITHIFIDEFQDTSKLQWNCFKFLLDETIANGKYNLIVGDVKQSIYRWRNSDWNIMNDIGNFHPETTRIASQEVCEGEKKYSSTNYRSCRRIVTFNNRLYTAALKSIEDNFKDKLGNDISKLMMAYKDVEQAVPAKKGNEGYVEMRFLAKDNIVEANVQQLMNTLDELLNVHQIPPKDIAILLRSNTYIPNIVEAFKKKFSGLKIVSNEAYKLSASMAVQLIISALRHIACPEDEINLVNLVTLYREFIEKQKCDSTELIEKSNRIKFLPTEYIEEMHILKGLPIYELIERIISLLNITEITGEDSYLFSFLDQASQCINNKAADIDGFLELWNDSLRDKTIPAAGKDCITVMTIHSSKGLEFGTVILPFCNWEVTGRANNTLWCQPNEAPYNTLSLLPINSKMSMLDSIYKDDYTKDYLYQIVDNLNILYVGTTRARNNLVIFTDDTKKADEPKNMPLLIRSIMGEVEKLDGATYDKEGKVYRYGDTPTPVATEEKKEKKNNPFIIENEGYSKQGFTSFENRITFKQSRELARFLATDSKEKQSYASTARGELMHSVLARINRPEELHKQLNKMLIEGLISTEKEMLYIESVLTKALAQTYAQEWFSGKYKLFNECAILNKNLKDGKTNYRPDRVLIQEEKVIVIDYKFAKPSDKHKEQVSEYMKLIGQMGYSTIEGYVWYVDKNIIEKV